MSRPPGWDIIVYHQLLGALQLHGSLSQGRACLGSFMKGNPMEMLKEFFDSSSFMPHGHCYLWQPGVLWLHVISDALIVLAYYSIPLALIYFVGKRRDLVFNWIFILFAAFIFWCGTTHLMNIWVVWNPTYWIDGGIKAITAAVSVGTAVVLWPLLPKALQLPSPSELQRINEQLKEQIEHRTQAETRLWELNQQLEQRVEERTQALAEANARLEREAKEREAAGRAAQELAAIVESSSDAIIGKDLSGIIRTWNQAAERMYGYSAKEMIGRSVELIVPDDRRDELKGILTALAKGEAVGNLETVRITKEGRRLEVSLAVSPVRNEAGRIVGGSSVARDITERKRTEKVLERQTREMEQFAYVVSHDLREPLRAMAGYAYLLQKTVGERLEEKERGYVQEVLDAAKRMDQLITDLLSYARVGRVERPTEPVALEGLIGTILQDLKVLLEKSGAVIDHGELPSVQGHVSLLRQVFQNLITNAIKYSRDDEAPRVNLRARKELDGWRFEVEDQGPGIPLEHQERIFNLFHRLSPREQGEGLGLGLAISRKIVEAWGGRIWVESDGRCGSRFCFTLPRGMS